jgi:hypothetical protein
LLWVKTPHYLMDKDDVIKLLQQVLVGQANENDWAIFLATSFRHSPALNNIRSRCAAIDENAYIGHAKTGFLFTESGLGALREILVELEKLDI